MFQMLACDVALGGDDRNVVPRMAHNPVSYPELLILQYLHGEDSVRNVYVLGHTDRDDADERARLGDIYGNEVLGMVFPVRHMTLPASNPGFPAAPPLPAQPPAAVQPSNPLDIGAGLFETAGAA